MKTQKSVSDKSFLNKELTIKAFNENLPLKQVFRIARGAKTQANVVVVTIDDGTHCGWAEAVPYARYNESVDIVMEQINAISLTGVSNENISEILSSLPAGATRNALDCAWFM